MDSTYCDIDGIIELSTVENTLGGDLGSIHYHKSYEIYILEKGSRSYLIGTTLIDMAENDVCFIKPYEIHTTGGGSYKRHLITFKEEYLDRYFTSESKEVILKCFENKKTHLFPTDYDYFKILFKTLSENTSDFITFIKLMELFFSVPVDIAPNKNAGNPTLDGVIKYIGENYCKIESLDEIAKKFYISKYYLCRLFKSYTGISVFKYINTLKLRYACELLSKTQKTPDEISSECGFNSLVYFSKIFKSTYNITPLKYRKQYMKKRH